MTAAVHFSSRGFFPSPSCLDTSAVIDARGDLGSGGQWIRDLSLAEIMAFYWNVETFTLTTSAAASGIWPPPGGTAYSGTANGTFALSPLAVTGDCTADTFLGNESAWMKVNGSALYTAGMTSTPPCGRVCGPHLPGYVLPYALYLAGYDSALGRSSCSFRFVVAADSVNTGRYAIGYYFVLRFALLDPGGATSGWVIDFSSVSLVDRFADGTFTLAGFTFPYSCGTDLPLTSAAYTTSGGTLTATSASFTF